MIERSTGLGSLAQTARMKQLNVARGLLLFIGILGTVVNVVLFTTIESQVNAEIQKLQGQRMVVDANAVAQVIRTAKLIQGGFIAVSVVFIVFGLIVKKYPVPITVTALVLYVGATAITALLVPESLWQGLIIKVIIIVALGSSVRAALAYQRDENRLAAQRSLPLEQPGFPPGPTDFPPPKTEFPPS